MQDVSNAAPVGAGLSQDASLLALVALRTRNLVIITDPQSRIVWVNRAFEEVSQFTLEEVRGRTPGAVLQGPCSDPQTVRDMRMAVRSGGSFVGRIANHAKDGSVYWVHHEIQPVKDPAGRITHFISVQQNVTAQKQVEDALAAARNAADAASRAKSDFLANMSHEIRTPMTAILGYADMLADPSLDEGRRGECVETIRRNGQHLLGIISDILDIARMEAGRLSIEVAGVNPSRVVGDVVELMGLRAKERGLELRVVEEGPIPAAVATDATRLRQVLVNLVGNAIKFTQRGCVTIRLRHRPAPTPTLQLRVEDTGCGIPDTEKERLFQPFFQIDGSHTRRHGGTGLGLTISRNLTRLMGGNIIVADNHPCGSVFCVQVAAPRIDAATGPDRRAPDAPVRGGERLDGLRILLAEDGPDNQRLIRHVLTKAGAAVEVVENGRLACEALGAGERFDLVLMDIQMPEMDGYEATRRLRNAGFDLPIVALTAHAMAGDREKCLSAGCDDYFTKPLAPKPLIGAIWAFCHGLRGSQRMDRNGVTGAGARSAPAGPD